MPEDEHEDAESDWLLEPPEPGEVQVNIAIGPDVELSPEAREALETLMSSLQESEVSGFASLGEADLGSKCPTYRICKSYGWCQPLTTAPCLVYTRCRIGGFAE